MTWQMWVESIVVHFSVPFTVAYFMRRWLKWHPYVVLLLLAIGICAVEVYQYAIWGRGTWEIRLDRGLDVGIGFLGTMLALDQTDRI